MQKAGVAALFEDHRPYYDNATKRSREEGLYRQNYCGCRFSDEGGGGGARGAEAGARREESVRPPSTPRSVPPRRRAAREEGRAHRLRREASAKARDPQATAGGESGEARRRLRTAPVNARRTCERQPLSACNPRARRPATPAASPNDDAKKEPTC